MIEKVHKMKRVARLVQQIEKNTNNSYGDCRIVLLAMRLGLRVDLKIFLAENSKLPLSLIYSYYHTV